MISEVFNQDCMDGMRNTPDKFYDLAVVDPPYGLGINMNLGRRKGKRKKHDDKNWDNATPEDQYFLELERVSVNQIIWGGNYFNLPSTQCFLIWDKACRFRRQMPNFHSLLNQLSPEMRTVAAEYLKGKKV